MLVQRAIGDTLGAPIVAPFLVAGSTDCRHYHRSRARSTASRRSNSVARR
jgi:hypothetical protein